MRSKFIGGRCLCGDRARKTGGQMETRKHFGKETDYCHNPNYCMIRPDADTDEDNADDDIVSTGQS